MFSAPVPHSSRLCGVVPSRGLRASTIGSCAGLSAVLRPSGQPPRFGYAAVEPQQLIADLKPGVLDTGNEPMEGLRTAEGQHMSARLEYPVALGGPHLRPALERFAPAEPLSVLTPVRGRCRLRPRTRHERRCHRADRSRSRRPSSRGAWRGPKARHLRPAASGRWRRCRRRASVRCSRAGLARQKCRHLGCGGNREQAMGVGG